MAICDGAGRPIGFSLHSADEHESQCVEDVLESIPPADLPEKIIGDRAYDSQNLQHHLAADWEIILDAPLRKNNKQLIDSDQTINKTDRKNRWKIERLFSWMKGFRRVNTRWDYHPEHFLSWVFLAATVILFFRF